MADWQGWVAVGLAVAAVGQQLAIYLIRRRAKKREELFQIISENAADMIALVDVKGRRLYNSPAYKRILGYSPAELGETSAFEQIHPDDRFKVLAASREARQTGVGEKLEYRIRHKDGTWRVLESAANTIRNGYSHSDHLYHRARRHPNVGSGHEGGRGRVSSQALPPPGSAGCDSSSPGARPDPTATRNRNCRTAGAL